MLTTRRTWVALIMSWVLLSVPSAYGAPVATIDVEPKSSAQLAAEKEQRERIRQQMLQLGVDPGTAGERVEALTAEELTALDRRLSSLPVGQGLSTVELLLIIIIIILIV